MKSYLLEGKGMKKHKEEEEYDGNEELEEMEKEEEEELEKAKHSKSKKEEYDDDDVEEMEKEEEEELEEAKHSKSKKEEYDDDDVEEMEKEDLDAINASIPDRAPVPPKSKKEKHFKEDLDALIGKEATLSEGFKAKAEVIFEAALKAKLKEEVEYLEASFENRLNEEIETIQTELVEKVDSYLNYVVENWMEENELAITNGLRTEIAESFISSLHDVFTEHYVSVPESKIDLVDELSEKVQAMESELNESIRHNIILSKGLKEQVRDSIIREFAYDLSESQVEKLRSLSEDIDFVSEDSFREKIDILKESYFGNDNSTSSVRKMLFTEEHSDIIDEEFNDVNDTANSVSPIMEKYLSAFK